MSNLFVNLPMPVFNGPGAAVATSGMGVAKTITCEGDFAGATIIVEASVDGGVVWAPVTGFQSGDSQDQFRFSATHMRVNVSGRTNIVPFTANVDVGAPDDPASFAVIPIPVNVVGPGASVNVSAFGSFSTFIAGGQFPGAALRVEVSEDNIAWAPLLSFIGQGSLKNHAVTMQFVRANVVGHPIVATLAMGAAANPIVVSGFGVPEMWGQDNVIANQAAVALTTKVSTLFPTTFKMMRSGSFIGLCTRFNAPITAGTATVIVTKNGAPTSLSVVHTSVLNPTGGIKTQNPAIDTYVAGDQIGISITTDAGFLPITDDVEAWLEVSE